jgi:hypothetical protein
VSGHVVGDQAELDGAREIISEFAKKGVANRERTCHT